MNRFFENHGRYLLVLTITFLLFVLTAISFVSFVTYKNYFYKIYLGSDVTEMLGILSLSVSLTAFSSIIFSLQQTRIDRQNELKQTTIDLFKELRGTHFRGVRDKAWSVKLKWDKDNTTDGYRIKLINAMFNEKVNSESGIEITKEQIQALYDLVGFYTILSLYRSNEQDIRSLNYFYYGWWRKFLYEIAEFKDSNRIMDLFDENAISKNDIKFNRNTYIENITLRPILQRLDKLCGFEGVPEKFEFHKSGG